MSDFSMLRLAMWGLPLAMAYGLFLRQRPVVRARTGILLAIAWNVWTVLLVNLLAMSMGWWSFPRDMPNFMGVPVEAWFGWTVLWGVVAPLLAPDRPISFTVVAFLWLDLIAMPMFGSIVALGDTWLVGEAVAVGVALVPSMLLARWTAADSRLVWRTGLQVVCATGLLLGVVTCTAVNAGGGWSQAIPSMWVLVIGLQLLVVPAALGMRAVLEFVERGNGTPIPFDPPRRLVASGPYSYVRNPMQLAMVVAFLLIAVVLGNVWMVFAAVVAVSYSIGLARWHEDLQLEERFGSGWRLYRSRVRAWLPKWRPVVTYRGTLLVAYSCSTCSSIGRWFIQRRPLGLDIAPAEDSEDPGIRRISYRPESGPSSTGVAAIARALEHLNLGWALVGWILALPGVTRLAQLIADVCGPGPQRVAGLPYDLSACDTEPNRPILLQRT